MSNTGKSIANVKKGKDRALRSLKALRQRGRVGNMIWFCKGLLVFTEKLLRSLHTLLIVRLLADSSSYYSLPSWRSSTTRIDATGSASWSWWKRQLLLVCRTSWRAVHSRIWVIGQHFPLPLDPLRVGFGGTSCSAEGLAQTSKGVLHGFTKIVNEFSNWFLVALGCIYLCNFRALSWLYTHVR